MMYFAGAELSTNNINIAGAEVNTDNILCRCRSEH